MPGISRGSCVALVWSLVTSLSGAGCGRDFESLTDGYDDGSLVGALAVYVADDFEGRGETRYALRTASGDEHPLRFDQNVDLPPGTALAVRGTAGPDGIRVTSFRQVLPSTPPTLPTLRRTSALISGSVYPPRSFAFVMVDIGGGINVTRDGVLGTLDNDPNSLRTYYSNVSFGRQTIDAQVFGPFTYALTACATADTNALARALRPMIPGTFHHYLWYLGSRQPSCAWAGLASVGTPDTPSRDTWYNASTNCVVLVQEPGHNFGMQHSSSLICPGVSFADDPNDCTTDEYGDPFDPMGSGCRHMNAWQKAYQGWFGGCNGVAVTASGTFTLLPIEHRCGGAQFLKIRAAKPRSFNRPAAGGGGASVENMAYYYVELRTPTDFDGTLANRSPLPAQILIHVGDDTRDRTQRGVHTYLLDMTPSTGGRAGFGDAALKVGSTFTDPAGGVSITADAVGVTQATIAVDIAGGTGEPTCLDDTTFVTPGPGPESCGVGNVGGTTGAGATGGRAGAGGAPSPGERAGSGGMSGSGGSDGDHTADGGADEGGSARGGAPDGCGCAIQGSRSGGSAIGLVLFVGWFARRRR